MWEIAALIAAVLGAVFGWSDPSDYFGAIPPPLTASLMFVGGLLGVWWFERRAAEVEHIPAGRAVVGGGVVAVAVVLLMMAAGYSRPMLTAGGYFGFIGGIAMTIYPILSLGSAVFGALVGVADSLLKSHVLALNPIITTSVAFAVFLPIVWSANVSVRLPKRAKHRS
jgi:hypothetical protein